MDTIGDIAARHRVNVLDDAACAIGSRNRNRPVGSLAPVTVFSLHARKLVTTGEGGMIVTDDEKLAGRLRRLRHQGMSLSDFQRHGMSPTTFEEYPEIGYNFRITDIQAAMGRVQLSKLDEMIALRSKVAGRYLDYLNEHPLFRAPTVPEGISPNWQSFMIGVRDEAKVERNRVMEMLHEKGVPSRRSVMASHLEAPYRGIATRLPQTERAFRQNLLLPMHPGLSESQQVRVIDALSEITQKVTGS